jgi:hypothetical protein
VQQTTVTADVTSFTNVAVTFLHLRYAGWISNLQLLLLPRKVRSQSNECQNIVSFKCISLLLLKGACAKEARSSSPHVTMTDGDFNEVSSIQVSYLNLFIQSILLRLLTSLTLCVAGLDMR